MTKGVQVDRIALHQTLWSKADRFGRVEIYQTGLAQELNITNSTMSLIIKEFTEEGRLRKVGARKRNIGIYVVKDPVLFEHPFVPYEVPGIGVIRCVTCNELEQVGKHTPPTYP